MERAVILCAREMIEVEHLPVELRGQSSNIFASPTTAETPPAETNGSPVSLADMEKVHIEAVLAQCDGNKSETARQLGISRSTLREKMKLYGIDG